MLLRGGRNPIRAALPVILALLALALVSGGSARAQQAPPVTTYDLARLRYGLGAAPLINETDYTVGTTPVQIHKLDSATAELNVSNTGSSNCAVSTSASVTTTTGTLLGSGGGFFGLNWVYDMTLPTYTWYAVCSASGGTLHVSTVDLQ